MLPGAPDATCAGEPTAPDPEAGFGDPAAFEAPGLAPAAFESEAPLTACAGAADPGALAAGLLPEQALARTIARAATRQRETLFLDTEMPAAVTLFAYSETTTSVKRLPGAHELGWGL